VISKNSRILFVRLSAVGDVINTLPALEAVRAGFPRAFIGFAVEDRAHDLIRGHPSVDRVHLFRRRRWVKMARRPLQWGPLLHEVSDFVREIRRERYDVALDFQSNLKGTLHGLLSGARLRVGFSRGHTSEGNHFFNNLLVTPPGVRINRVEKFLSLAAALGVPTDRARYRLPEPAESRDLVGSFLAREGISWYVAIHPGTSDFGKEKRWMPERFSALARKIAGELGLRSVITWGPAERSLAEEVVRGSGSHALLSPETRSVLDLAEVLRRARLFVGCDSGPLHLSSAVGTPSVALFGPKDPQVYGPYNPVHHVVYKTEGGNGSMEAITVEDAFKAVADLLRETASPTSV
jgi:ADP-heptose:LPS heptosyltransferase